MVGMWKRMSYFTFDLPNHPGELSRFVAQLRDADIDLLGLWGFGEGQEQTRISCVPVLAEAFRMFMESGNMDIEEGHTFYLTGKNEPGALVDSLQHIAEAGVNIDTIECVAAGGEYGCFIWADETNWAALEKLLT